MRTAEHNGNPCCAIEKNNDAYCLPICFSWNDVLVTRGKHPETIESFEIKFLSDLI